MISALTGNSYAPVPDRPSAGGMLLATAVGIPQLASTWLVVTGHELAPWIAGFGLLAGLGTVTWSRSARRSRWCGKKAARKAALQRLSLLHRLPLRARNRYLRLMTPVRQACLLLGRPLDPCSGAGAPRRLEHLLWLYLRLLTAEHQLRLAGAAAELEELEREAGELRLLLAAPGGPAIARSRQAALDLIGRRLAMQAANDRRLEEVECDLRRIEHHCGLFLEQAAHAGSMGDVSLMIDLDLTAGGALEAFSEASQQMLQEGGRYYLSPAA